MKKLYKRFAVILCIAFFIQCLNFSQVIPYYGAQVNAEGCETDGKVLKMQTVLASPAKFYLAHGLVDAEVSDTIVSNTPTSTTADPIPTPAVPLSNGLGAYYKLDGVVDSIIKPAYALDEKVINDVTPPEVQFYTDVSPNSDGWYRSDVSLSIKAKDSGSGVDWVRYSINGGDELFYHGTVILDYEGTNFISATAVDKKNNSSKPLLQEIKIDKTYPEINIYGPKGPISKGDRVKINFEVIDKLSGVDYVKATMNRVPVKNGDEILIDKPGMYDLDIMAYDKAGNISGIGAIYFTSEYRVSGYISSGFSMEGAASDKLKAGFKVEIAATGKYAITDQNGIFEISDMPDFLGGNLLIVSKRGYLSRRISVGELDGDLVIGSEDNPVDIWSGDINGDGCINLIDIVEFSKSYNKTIGDPLYDPAKDYNMDGSINMKDIMLAARYFNTGTASYPAVIK